MGSYAPKEMQEKQRKTYRDTDAKCCGTCGHQTGGSYGWTGCSVIDREVRVFGVCDLWQKEYQVYEAYADDKNAPR